jgi:glycine cleavage system transcriptional repressor
MSSKSCRYVILVLVVDRVGVLRDIIAPIAGLKGNIDGIQQTVVGGYFTVTLTASFGASCRAEDVREAIAANFSADEASVVVRPHEAHPRGRAAGADAVRYVVTIVGADTPGVLKAVTAFFAAKGINIEDWFVQFEASGVTQVGEVTVPRALDIRQVQDDLRRLLKPLRQTGCLQQINIFRATNEIGPIRNLLGGSSHA